jgi:hypothetical protein
MAAVSVVNCLSLLLSNEQKVACTDHVGVTNMGGRYQCGGYLPHIINCSLVDLHCTLSCSRNTTDSQLHAMISIVRLARSFVFGADVIGACDVVSVTSPSPCARLPHHHVGESHTPNECEPLNMRMGT